jgi:hypothetical protein
MKFNLNSREKRLVFIAFLAMAFMLFWYFLLNPILSSVGRTEDELKKIKVQFEAFKLPAGATGEAAGISLYPKEEQLNRILELFDRSLISLNQTAAENQLTIELKFKSSDSQLLSLINSLSKLKTVLVIDKVKITQSGDKIITEMRLISAYL